MTTATQPTDTQRAEQIVVNMMSALRERKDPAFFRLKRGSSVLDALLEPAFHQVRAELRRRNLFANESLLAVALLLLARVDNAAGTKSLPRALSDAGYSEQRFSTLIRCDEPEELFTQLQRALRFCKGKVSPFSLARTALSWTESQLPQTRPRLIAEFYSFSQEAA
jgi:CRISPR type I-E-associated protein CasB/Cse2